MVGGINVDSDELTANRSHVLSGHTAITHDSDGDPVAGTMPDLSNKTLERSPNSADVKEVSNYWSTATGYGGDLTIEIPHSGYIKNTRIQQAVYGIHPSVVKAGALIGANADTGFARGTFTSDANATEDKILSGYSGYVNGNKVNGKLTVQSVVSFKVAQYSTLTLIASWAKPAKGPWSGLRIICKQGGYPANVNDGTLFYEGSATSAAKKLATGTWYFRAWNYITTNYGRLYGNYLSTTAVNSEIKGQQVFTSSGVFTVPDKVYEIEVFLVGGGGRGGTGTYYEKEAQGGPGGGGGYTGTKKMSVTPNVQYPVVVGAGSTDVNSPGGSSSMNGFEVMGGESKRYWGLGNSNGGSGGGSFGESFYDNAGDGGSDGSDGGMGSGPGGKGQGTTTRAFGEAWGTLYAGGGGGGGYNAKGSSTEGNVGYGGAGGGGNGGYGNQESYRYGLPGVVNTGGGGGGGGSIKASSAGWAGGNGGSGIAIVRWGY